MFSQLDAGIAVLRVAQRYLDMSEVQSNATWSRPGDSAEIRKLLLETGWQPGWPYCAAFVEVCWAEAAKEIAPEAVRFVRNLFTPSVMQTYRNVEKWITKTRPAPGSVFFMQKGTSALGHAGVVTLSGYRTFGSVEGNTSPGVVDDAKDREGDGFYLKLRRIDFTPHPTKLHLLGFLAPPSSDIVDLMVKGYAL